VRAVAAVPVESFDSGVRVSVTLPSVSNRVLVVDHPEPSCVEIFAAPRNRPGWDQWTRFSFRRRGSIG
jgi:hypothetical protein